MSEAAETVVVNLRVEMEAEALRTIVETARARVGRDEKGHYRVDTADLTGDLVSRFLAREGFTAFVADPANYDGE